MGWLAGVAINLVGSIMINLGTNVMKMGHNRLAAIPYTSSRPRPAIYKLREWQIGVSLFSVGNVANFVSFGYAAQSLLAAIGCIQFVSNVIFASWVLKEQVSRGVMAATACIVAGCVLLVSGGSHVSEKYTYKQLLHLYGQPGYVCYLSLGAVAVVLAYGGYWWGQKAVISKPPEATRLWTAVLPILYSIFSALIGTQSVLFSKTLAVLLRSTVTGDNQLKKWFTWFVLVAFLTSAVFWVTRLNKGLRMFPALIIVPALQICWTLFSILSGMLYFQEYRGMKPGPTAMFVVGVAVVFAGVFLLTRASQPGSPTGAGQPGALKPLGNKAHIAYVVGESPKSSSGPSTDEQRWELAAVRHEGAGLQNETTGALRGSAELQQQPPQQPEDADASDEEEYERALLAYTSGRCAGNSNHLGSLQKQGQQGPLHEHGYAAPGAPAGPSTAAGGPASRTKQRWLLKASSLKRRMALDFSLDEAAAAKLSLGLGDSHTPGFSLFTMPMVDIKEIPHETSTWRAAEAVDGKAYGRLADTSMGGSGSQQGLPRLSVPAELDETGCISHAGAQPNVNSSSYSFTWPPGGSDPSEQELPVLGPFTSINPLSCAIDVNASNAATKAVTPPGRTQEEPSIQGHQESKWKVLQKAIKTNVQELKEIVQAAGDGSNNGRAYTRMTSKEGPAAESSGSPRSSAEA